MSRSVKDLRDMICASRLSSRHPNGFVAGSDDDDDDDDDVVQSPIVTVTRPPSSQQMRPSTARPFSRVGSRAGQFSRIDGSLNDAVLPFCDARIISGLLRESNTEVRKLQVWWGERPDDVALFHEFVISEWSDERRAEFGNMQLARVKEDVAAAFVVGMDAGRVCEDDLNRLAKNVFHEYPDSFEGASGRETLLDLIDGVASGKGERFKHLLSDVRSSAANSEFAQWLLAMRSYFLVSFSSSVIKFYRTVYRERREECRRRKRERKEKQLRRMAEREKERQYLRSKSRRRGGGDDEDDDDGRGAAPDTTESSSETEMDERDLIDVSSESSNDVDSDAESATPGPGGNRSGSGRSSTHPSSASSSASSSGRDSRAAFTVRDRPGSVMRSSNPFPDSNRAPIAFSAARLGLVGTIGFLVPRRVPTDARDEQGKSLLATAIAAKRSACVTALLLRCRCDVNESIGEAGNTPLHVAATVGDAAIAQMLMENGAAINARSHGGEGPTPLHCAVMQGHKSVVALLVQWGADSHAVMGGEDGMTSIELAKQAQRYDIVEMLRVAGGSDSDEEQDNDD